VGDFIASGSYGLVFKIYDLDNKEYIIKISNKTLSGNRTDDTIVEGVKSDMLIGILDDASIIKYQGILKNTYDSSEYGYLISEYNGETVQNTYSNSLLSIDNKKRLYIFILSSILCYIHNLNINQIYHNDIKLNNIVIAISERDTKVRLIDFGFLTNNQPYKGTHYSMSFKSVIHMRNELFGGYSEIVNKFNFLKLTDCFGFFYCCVDLLNLLSNNSGSLSLYILYEFGCINYKKSNLDNLINLYYYILPDMIKKDLNISVLDEKLNYSNIDKKLPNISETIDCFDKYLVEDMTHINLYKYIKYIYNKIKERQKVIVDDELLKQFLIIISQCLKHDFELNIDFYNKVKEYKLF
jgi:serine/threonine protein kinase